MSDFMRTLCKIAIPVTLQGMLQASFSIVDQIMIGQLGEAGIAAVGLCSNFTLIFSVMSGAVGTVSGILIAQFLGAEEYTEAWRSLDVSLVCGGVLAALFLLTAGGFPAQVLGLYTADDAILRVGAGYFRIVAFSYLPMAVSTVLSAWLRCKEHAAVPFWAFSIVLFFLLIAIWMCAKLWLESKNDKAVPTISIIECSHNVCICKTHDFITYNSIVTFYKKDGNFEKLIGFGLVETINSGGKTAQIRIVPGDMRNKNQVSASEISDFVSYINDNKNNIIVRPTITSDIVPYIYKILNQEVSNE